MREILFRGKRFSAENDWYYGDLYHRNEEVLINNYCEGFNVSVIPETVGQFTGLTDKNGTKIFEGDIVMLTFEGTGSNYDENGRSYEEDYYGHKTGVVSFGSNGTFLNVRYGELWINGEDVEGWTPTRRTRIAGYRSEVIGNIHDNPELLEVGNNA